MDVRTFICLFYVVTVLPNYAESVLNFRRPTKCGNLFIRRARIKLRNRGRIAVVICNYGFQLFGDKYVLCEGGQWVQPLPSCTKPGCPTLANAVPNGRVVESKSSGVAYIYCNDGNTLTGSPTLLCDGVSWNDTVPSCHGLSDFNKFCDFEDDSNNLCGWANDKKDNFEWEKHSMATPSNFFVDTGPTFDHTLGEGSKGHYMYIEATSKQPGSVARLLSPVFQPVVDDVLSCFIFWYHMYGTNIGSLNVYVGSDKVFSEFGNHGKSWIEGLIPLNTTVQFQIIIEAIRGNGYASDIAIDDLKLATGLECIQDKTKVTELTLPGSCSGRCHDNSTTDQDACLCQEECHSNSTCCADYVQICGLAHSTNSATPKTYTPDLPTNSLPPISVFARTESSSPLSIPLTTELSLVRSHSTAAYNYSTATIKNVSSDNDIIKTLKPNVTYAITQTIQSNTVTVNFNDFIDVVRANVTVPQFETTTKMFITTSSCDQVLKNGNCKPSTSSEKLNVIYLSNNESNDIVGANTADQNKTIQPVLNTTREFPKTIIPKLVFLTPTTPKYYRGPQINTTTSSALNATRTLNVETSKVQVKFSPNKTVSINKNYTQDVMFGKKQSVSKLAPNLTDSFPTSKRKMVLLNETGKSVINVNKTVFNQTIFHGNRTAFVAFGTNSSVAKTNKTIYDKDNIDLPYVKQKSLLYYLNRTGSNNTKSKQTFKPLTVTTIPIGYKAYKLGDVKKPLVMTTPSATTTNTSFQNKTLELTAYRKKMKYMISERLNLSKSNSVTSKWNFSSYQGDHAYYKYDKSSGHPQLIIEIVLGVLTLTTVVSVVICFIRKRKINRHGSDDDGSDVQFLTSDELIDFNVARPRPESRNALSTSN